MDDIPAHRAGFAARSGDTHVIGKDGKSRNVDQAARDAARAAKKASPKKRAAKKRPAAKKAPTTAAPSPTPAATAN